MRFTLVILLLAAWCLWLPASPIEEFPRWTGDELFPSPKAMTFTHQAMPLEVFQVEAPPELSALQALLERNLLARGARRAPAGGAAIRIVLGIGEAAGLRAPACPEGYAVSMAPGRIALAGQSHAGVLWGISSLLQMTHRTAAGVQIDGFSGTDWPDLPVRGALCPGGGDIGQLIQFCLAVKKNYIVKDVQVLKEGLESNAWLNQAPDETVLANIARLRDAGQLGLHFGVHLWSASRQLAACDEEAYQRFLQWAKPLAAAGVDVEILSDDNRFPLAPADQQRFGSAAAADAWFLRKVHADLKSVNPECTVFFCPAFYWGPGNDPSREYGEDRDTYLRTIGSQTPIDLPVYYTGNLVFGGKVEASQVAWFRERLGAHPIWFFNNSKDSPHVYGYSFGADPVRLFTWHYDGFYQEVRFLDCALLEAQFALVAAGADYLWNRAAYDPVRSPQRAIARLVGPDNLDVVDRLDRALSAFDRFEWQVTPGAVRSLPQLAAASQSLQELWKEAGKRGIAETLAAWTGYGAWIPAMAKYVEQLQQAARNSNIAAFDESAMRRLAAQETGAPETGGVLLSPYRFNGGILPEIYRYEQKQPPRLCTGVRGRHSNHPVISADFAWGTISSEPVKLWICGQDDDQPEACRVRILLNGAELFEGPNPLDAGKWGIWPVAIPGGVLKEGANTLVIEGSDDHGAPVGGSFFLINYILIR